MRFLLTSAGIRNTSIQAALVDLLGKPIADSSALCIPTGMYGHPHVRPDGTWRFISGRETQTPMCELGWKSLGVLELTALPSIGEERWVPWVRETDVLLVGGGDALYLCHWMRQSGLADLLPSLPGTVWVGLSAGSMVMTPGSGRLRRVEAAHRWRQHARSRGLLDLPAPGSRDAAGEHHGRRREMGGRYPRPGVRNRRRDRHQRDRRRRRSRLRRALEAVHSRLVSKRIALGRPLRLGRNSGMRPEIAL